MIREVLVAAFEDSIEAAKIASRAIEGGLLDDYGASAEIAPFELLLSEAGETLGVTMRVTRT